MADAPLRSGSALRVYQILLILGVGWLAGRLPALFASNELEQGRLLEALKPGEPASATPSILLPPADTAEIAAEVGAQVAAEVASRVASETVARLIAAGWGPQSSQPPQQIIIQQPQADRSKETVVRVITEQPQQLAGLSYSLPPGQPANPSGQPASSAPSSAPPASQAATPSAKPASEKAYAQATAGYAALKAGDRREGVRLLSEAVLLDPSAPQAASWSADVKRLTRRWSIAAYTLARDGGNGDPLAASPVLGGGQSGAAVAYTLDPLARRRIAAFARVAAATGPNGTVDRETAEAALGIRLQPLPKVPVSIDVERRFALGAFGRNAWSARVSGGTSRSARAANKPVMLEAYGEAGMINFSSPDLYAGGQARAATPLYKSGRLSIDAGAGVWAAAQDNYNETATRFDIGPSTRIAIKPYAFTAQIDYRFRMLGNALPASGPALTVAGEF